MKHRITPTAGPALSNRPGAVLVVVLICTLLASVILGTLLQLAATGRRQSRVHARSLQADWLAESGIERAAAQLSTNPDYKGETWQIPAEEINGRHAGIVKIEIGPLTGYAEKRNVLIRADFPAGDLQRIRKSKQIVINLSHSIPALPEDADE